jgi:hypothetical protein
MNSITEKTNAELSITLDNVEQGAPISVFFFERYGQDMNTRITVASYSAPEKGTPQAVVGNTYDLFVGDYVVEVWSNIDTQDEQLELTMNAKVVEARAV